MNSPKVAAALRALADAIDDGGRAELEAQDARDAQILASETPKAAPQKRGRGRPVKGEETAAPAAVTTPTTPATVAAATASEADPFEAAPTAPTATLQDVRDALTALRAATSQETALAILKIHGQASNVTELHASRYAGVVEAAKARQAEAAPKPAVEADPFEVSTATAPAAAPAKPLTLEDVKAEVVAAQKRTSVDTVQKLVMSFGGKGKNPDTGAEAPSLKALPESQFAATIAALKALPGTK